MKKYLKYIVGLALIGIGLSTYMYYKPHKNINAAKIDINLSAEAVFTAFESDEATANEQYLDKIVAVSGTVKEVNKNDEGITTVTLDAGQDMFGVVCQLDQLTKHPRENFPVGEQVTFKGICTGMLMDVVLVRCVEIVD
ncbi:MAG: hypothetical protein R2828_03510 [Saprospiraceae bacterium]